VGNKLLVGNFDLRKQIQCNFSNLGFWKYLWSYPQLCFNDRRRPFRQTHRTSHSHKLFIKPHYLWPESRYMWDV